MNPELHYVVDLLGIMALLWIGLAALIALVGFAVAVLPRRRRHHRFHGARCREIVRSGYTVDDSGTRVSITGECGAPLRAIGGDDHSVDYTCADGHVYRASHWPVREGTLTRMAASDRPGATRPYSSFDDDSPEEPAGGPSTAPGRVARGKGTPDVDCHSPTSRPLSVAFREDPS